MYPVLIDTQLFGNSITLESYQILMGLAALTVLAVDWAVVRWMALPVSRTMLVITLMLLSVPVGARLLNILSKPGYYGEHPDLVFTGQPIGFSLMGGLFLAVVVGVVGARRIRVDPWRVADASAPGLLIGIAVMRVGCFLAGCCYGTEASVPWAVEFPFDSPAYWHYQASATDEAFSLFTVVSTPAVHPTQIYELVGCLACAALVLVLIRRNVAAGVPFLAGTIAFSLVRLGNHFLRVPSDTDQIPFLAYPLLYVTLIVVAGVALRWRMTAQSRPVSHVAPARTVSATQA